MNITPALRIRFRAAASLQNLGICAGLFVAIRTYQSFERKQTTESFYDPTQNKVIKISKYEFTVTAPLLLFTYMLSVKKWATDTVDAVNTEDIPTGPESLSPEFRNAYNRHCGELQ